MKVISYIVSAIVGIAIGYVINSNATEWYHWLMIVIMIVVLIYAVININKADNIIGGYDKELKNLHEVNVVLERDVNNHIETIGNLTDSKAQLQGSYDEVVNDFKNALHKLSENEATLDRLIESKVILEKDLDGVKTELSRAEFVIDGQQQTIEGMTEEIERLEVEVSNLNTIIQDNRIDVKVDGQDLDD